MEKNCKSASIMLGFLCFGEFFRCIECRVTGVDPNIYQASLPELDFSSEKEYLNIYSTAASRGIQEFVKFLMNPKKYFDESKSANLKTSASASSKKSV